LRRDVAALGRVEQEAGHLGIGLGLAEVEFVAVILAQRLGIDTDYPRDVVRRNAVRSYSSASWEEDNEAAPHRVEPLIQQMKKHCPPPVHPTFEKCGEPRGEKKLRFRYLAVPHQIGEVRRFGDNREKRENFESQPVRGSGEVFMRKPVIIRPLFAL
jgi:hypothetical protein